MIIQTQVLGKLSKIDLIENYVESEESFLGLGFMPKNERNWYQFVPD